jgi:hypothetical protein
MRLLNNALSDLKVYARREYSLTNNGLILVMLITEEEYRVLKDSYDNIVKANTENGATLTNIAKEENALHYSEEFFPNVAIIFELVHNYSSEARPIVPSMLREVFNIPHFGKYEYAIIIREEKLLEWGSQMDIQVEGAQATGNTRKLIVFYRILTHEFLHIVEREKGIQIFTNNEKADSETIQRALKEVKIFRAIDIFSDLVNTNWKH